MANVSVYNMEGSEVGTLELSDAVFGVEIKENLVHLEGIIARNRGENHTAARPLWSSSGSLSCVTGSLLPPWLCAAAAYL